MCVKRERKKKEVEELGREKGEKEMERHGAYSK